MDSVNSAQWGPRALEIGASYHDNNSQAATLGGAHGAGSSDRAGAMDGLNSIQNNHADVRGHEDKPKSDIQAAANDRTYHGVFGK